MIESALPVGDSELAEVENSNRKAPSSVHATRTRPSVEVSADGVGVVSHVGARLLADVADADDADRTAVGGVRRSHGAADRAMTRAGCWPIWR